MQGIEVTGMIVWSVFRDGDGPLKAYKCLGDDLARETPYESNEKLTSMSSAIVRHCIANSTIDEVLKNRKILRDTVSKEILGVVKGWGVWVETIEITDVKISSSSLFKDMQSKYREEQKLKAELERMEIERQLKEEKLKSELENSKKQINNDTSNKIYKASKD